MEELHRVAVFLFFEIILYIIFSLCCLFSLIFAIERFSNERFSNEWQKTYRYPLRWYQIERIFFQVACVSARCYANVATDAYPRRSLSNSYRTVFWPRLCSPSLCKPVQQFANERRQNEYTSWRSHRQKRLRAIIVECFWRKKLRLRSDSSNFHKLRSGFAFLIWPQTAQSSELVTTLYQTVKIFHKGSRRC